MAAYLDLPREPVAVQPWTLSLHLPTVAARLAAVDSEVRPLRGESGYKMDPGLEIRPVRLPSPMSPGLLDGLCFTRANGAEVWTAIHRMLPGSWDASLRPWTEVGWWLEVLSGGFGQQTVRVHPW